MKVDDRISHIRILTTAEWIAGPTLIFVGWFLMGILAGSQKTTGTHDDTSIALIFLFAFITSIPLVIVSLIGGGTTMMTTRLGTHRLLNNMAYAWNLIVFLIYFGLLGIAGTLPANGFPVTPLTIAALIPIVAVVSAFPTLLYALSWRAIVSTRRELNAPPAEPLNYDI